MLLAKQVLFLYTVEKVQTVTEPCNCNRIQCHLADETCIIHMGLKEREPETVTVLSPFKDMNKEKLQH